MVTKVGKFRDIRISFDDFMHSVIFIFVGVAMMLTAPSPYFEDMFGWGMLLTMCGIFLIMLDITLYLIRKHKVQKHKEETK